MSIRNLALILSLLSMSGCSPGLADPTEGRRPQSLPLAGEATALVGEAALDPSKGAVVGSLLLETEHGIIPVPNAILYLAETIQGQSGEESLAAFDRIRSPRATTDDQGRFAFLNVQAGRYGLVLDTVASSYLLLRPGEQEAVLIEVLEGNIADLGILTYESLPIGLP